MALRRLLWEAHADVRTYARYEQSLINTQKLYCEDGFKEVCNAYLDKLKNKIAPLICAVGLFLNRGFRFFYYRRAELFFHLRRRLLCKGHNAYLSGGRVESAMPHADFTDFLQYSVLVAETGVADNGVYKLFNHYKSFSAACRRGHNCSARTFYSHGLLISQLHRTAFSACKVLWTEARMLLRRPTTAPSLRKKAIM